MSDCGSGARNSFCSYLARIQRSFSSLRVEQRHTGANAAGLRHGAGAPAPPFERQEQTPRRRATCTAVSGALRSSPRSRHAPACTDLRLRTSRRRAACSRRATAPILHGDPSGPSTAERCPALPCPPAPRQPRDGQPRAAPRRQQEARCRAALSAALSLLPSRLQPTKAVAASVPPGAAGPPDRCAPCRRYLLPFYPSASGGRPSMPRAAHAHCSRPLTRSYPLIRAEWALVGMSDSGGAPIGTDKGLKGTHP